ncbi:serine hydrolase domain-containing protein [Mycobacterium paraffinicum]|uniref:serine hydrolase domain-containing protein n=1 Tax=Mycobacterium paraffinicum TaxID=53378 RepID=UPI001FC9273E|nr:serine hydrolase [Mycobacterium paraffinicum]
MTGGPDVHWLSWSVTKSFVSALVGIAVAEGHIGSIDEPISAYIPVESGSAYDGVSIRHMLQMSSGARWNEDYADPSSDIYRLAAAAGGAGTVEAFVASMVRESPPGTVCRYNSAETAALGYLLARATQRPLTAYMQEKLCEPMGISSNGYWLLDVAGTEMAFAGLMMTPYDFAKLGELYRNGGRRGGRQVVPADWVRASVTASEPHLMPGRVIINDHYLPLGYGYQWWVPEGDRGEFAAMGIYNQFVYVDPSHSAVIVKLSSNRTYGTTSDESTNRDVENIEFLRAIAARL